MPTLADTQTLFRDAVVCGDTQPIAPLLASHNAEKRLTVHQRNYHTSLIDALLVKFPATAWVAGSRFIAEAAARFVREYPPQAPCIAEYGRTFPKFLSSSPGAKELPYLHDFAELEWHVGQAAIAVSEPALSMHELAAVSTDALPDAIVHLQQGVCYIQASWPVDELMKLYLKDSAPDHFSMNAVDAWLEVRGARGEFDINRLEDAEYVFRQSISEGRSIGDAVERALDVDAGFDPGQALAELFATALVTAIALDTQGSKS
jgi:hypothetical protein